MGWLSRNTVSSSFVNKLSFSTKQIKDKYVGVVHIYKQNTSAAIKGLEERKN